MLTRRNTKAARQLLKVTFGKRKPFSAISYGLVQIMQHYAESKKPSQQDAATVKRIEKTSKS